MWCRSLQQSSLRHFLCRLRSQCVTTDKFRHAARPQKRSGCLNSFQLFMQCIRTCARACIIACLTQNERELSWRKSELLCGCTHILHNAPRHGACHLSGLRQARGSSTTRHARKQASKSSAPKYASSQNYRGSESDATVHRPPGGSAPARMIAARRAPIIFVSSAV